MNDLQKLIGIMIAGAGVYAALKGFDSSLGKVERQGLTLAGGLALVGGAALVIGRVDEFERALKA